MKNNTIIIIFILFGIIQLNAQKLIHVETKSTSLVFSVQDSKLKQAYFGTKLSQLDDLTKNGTIIFDAYSTFGTNEVNDIALQATHADGNTSTEIVFEDVNVVKEEDNNITKTTIRLKDNYYNFQVDLIFKAYYNEDMIEQWTEIIHEEKGSVTLYNYASSQLSFNASSYWLTQLWGELENEMNLKETELTQGIKIIDSKLGARAAKFATPSFFLSLNEPSNENSGEIIGASLAWPGSFKLGFEIDNYQDLRVLTGINPFASQYILEKGEKFKTPSLIYSYSNKGRGELSRNFHKWGRKYGIKGGDEPRLTLLNNWEATYFDFNEKKITEIIKDAASLDLELFLLDDGWFGNKYPRNNDAAGLGDWQVNKLKLPNGIGHLVEEATKEGIKFGIWVEPEMVNPKSELYEAHPDWVIGQPHREIIYRRNQLILDLSNPKVQEFVFNSVNDLLVKNPGIAYVKWDCNRFIQNGGSPYLDTDKQSHVQIEYANGILKVLEKIATVHPKIQMMLCSGGGGRMEYGSLKYFNEFWPSDNTDARQRVLIQWGSSMFFPAIATCNHVSDVPNNQTGRSTPLKFRFDVAMMGKFGMDLQPSHMDEDEFNFSKKAVSIFKSIRDVIYYGDLYRLESPYESNRVSLMYVEKEKKKAVLFVYQIHYHMREFFQDLKLEGIDPEKKYRITEINLKDGIKSRLSSNNKVISGEILLKSGIKFPNKLSEYESLVIELTEEK